MTELQYLFELLSVAGQTPGAVLYVEGDRAEIWMDKDHGDGPLDTHPITGEPLRACNLGGASIAAFPIPRG